MCVVHNKWDEAIDLAKRFNMPQVSDLFMKYTEHLVDQKLLANAIEINVQAKYYSYAAELVFKVFLDFAMNFYICRLKTKYYFLHQCIKNVFFY